ncbi:hypothetical protein M413DRAFT_32988 [Hebeloma cylindrosporum]|uniref:Uncharacterized protein n=1 Tax=Hebeloma cylindrosporum TaxID=76867 RepID=A0A0C3BDC8_HEBCY|nr:hypothetical protein M413DRAFT_32988 [Hebeloma cylindrosporum h7]
METRSRKAALILQSTVKQLDIFSTVTVTNYKDGKGIICLYEPAAIQKTLNTLSHAKLVKDVHSFHMAVDYLNSTNIVKAHSLFLQSSAQRLGDLEVDIRGISTLQALRLFEGVHFPYLYSFSTRTLPHEGLRGFLDRHTTIIDLMLGPCPQFPCPLESVPPLPHLFSVEGAAKCISPLVSDRTTRIFSQRTSVQDQSHLQLFQDLLVANSFVVNFSLEYHPADTKFLKDLVSAMPAVSALRLIEFPIDGKVPLPRGAYPWGARNWGTQFRALTRMTRFFLKSTDMLIKDPGNEVEERDLIRSWSGDTGEKHELLKEIYLWYGYGPEIAF